MSEQAENLNPDSIPFQIEDELGEIVRAEQPYPGVYYIAAQKNETVFTASEYYIVMKNTPTISQTVKNYGKSCISYPELLLYPLSDDKSGWRLVEYEGMKYLTQNHLPVPERETLHSIALYYMEYHPEYFGEYPVPTLTPAGYTLRHMRLDNGVYWLETDRCEQMLSVCYPIWSCELSATALSLERQTEYDQIHGIERTLGYVFFSQRNSCIPLFELMKSRGSINNIDRKSLMNAIWKDFPDYAIAHNLDEQSGRNDLLGVLLNVLGEPVELNRSAEHVIAMSPEMSTDFILW